VPVEVSLLMPFFNADRFIAEALESIQAQTETNWELIAIDDYSEDNSLEIIRNFAIHDKRIKIFSNQEKGILPALKLAFSKSKGKYIGRADADDIYPPQRLSKMVNLLKISPPKTIVTGMISYFSDNNVSRGYRKYEAWLNEINIGGITWSQIYRECVIASPNWLCSRAEMEKIGGFSDLDYPEDYDMVFKWYKNDFQVDCLAEVSLYWRDHPMRVSRISEAYQQKALFRLKIKRFLEIEKYTKLYLWGRGKKAKICASHLIGSGIDFHWMDLEERISSEKDSIPIEDFRITDLSNGAKLLIEVYSNPAQRRAMEDFLMGQNKMEGKDYWYL
jgi:glycosyltransferase involved in cell wall biosynthesis